MGILLFSRKLAKVAYTFTDSRSGAALFLCKAPEFQKLGRKAKDHFKFFWNRDGDSTRLTVDGQSLILPSGSLLCATYLSHIDLGEKPPTELTVISFNQPFYCIHTNDSEVSCQGFLFFGTDQNPMIHIPAEEQPDFDYWHRILQAEFAQPDRNQEEMLRILLKRFIILCTRLGRSQLAYAGTGRSHDLLREFNILVEKHYRHFHHVAEYARLLHRSPKSLSNLFAQNNSPSPLQILHKRIELEARRLLMFSDQSAKEIAYHLGFEEPASFSRFFKNRTGQSPVNFREMQRAQ